MKPKLEGKEFFSRIPLYRPDAEIKRFTRDLERKIWDLTKKDKHVYMCDSIVACRSCSYKELCVEKLKGGDIDYIIEADFEPKTYTREDKDEKVKEEIID